jgi:hypothetical protein
MIRRLLLLLALLALPGVATADEVKTIQYFDSTAFDEQLSRALPEKGLVAVAFPPGVPISNLPPRVSMWVAAVQNKGGSVQVAAIADGKQEQYVQFLKPVLLSVFSGFVGSAFPGMSDISTFIREYRLFRNLDGYDALLSFDKDNGNLTKMTLVPKAS